MKFWSFYPLFLTFFWAVSSDLYVAPAFQMDFSLDFTQDLYSCWLQYPWQMTPLLLEFYLESVNDPIIDNNLADVPHIYNLAVAMAI